MGRWFESNSGSHFPLMATKKLIEVGTWTAIAVAGAAAFGGIALNRGETINALWFVVAAACVYLIGYRFYNR